MKGSSRKNLSVFDFDDEEEAVEAASGKYTAKLRPELDPKIDETLNKYSFLRAFASDYKKQTDSSGVSCIDLHDGDSLPESFAVDSSETDEVSSDERTDDFNEVITTTSRCVEHGQEYSDEIEAGKFSTIAQASSLITSSSGNEREVLDRIPDDRDGWTSETQSLSPNDSDVSENEGYVKQPVSEEFYAAFDESERNPHASINVEDDTTVTVHPDYVTCGTSLLVEPRLTFSADCVTIEGSDTDVDDKVIVTEWRISDIIRIDSQWTESVDAALVKFRVRANAVAEPKEEYKEFVRFSVNDVRWLEKEQKIKNLAQRYQDVWSSFSCDGWIGEEDTLEPNLVFAKEYFTGIAEPIEDVIYPKGDPDAVSISKRDIDLLLPETFINDTIIDFFIKYLKNKIPPNEKQRFHFFNSFFFRKLADLDKDPGKVSEGRAAFLRVRKWTRKVNIFEKDYIFIPVNFNLHWSLLVICHPGEVATFEADDLRECSKVPCILHMDSLKGNHSGLKNILQSYLWEEWKERHPDSPIDYSEKFLNLRFVSLELPQQENSFDCGLFLLHYVELFLEEAPTNFNPFRITKFSSFLSADWFPPADASFKRSLIRKLIYDLLDPAQRSIPITDADGDPSRAYPECDDTKQEPVVEFLSSHCCPSTDIATERETQTKISTTFSVDVPESDEKSGAIQQVVLKSDSTCQTLSSAACMLEEHVEGDTSLASKTLEREEVQLCTTSHSPKDLHSLPESSNVGNMVIDAEVEGKTEPLEENLGYVPDSPTISSEEKNNACCEVSGENHTTDVQDAVGEATQAINDKEISIPTNELSRATEAGTSDADECSKIEARKEESGSDVREPSRDIIIADDENSSDKDEVQVTGTRFEQQPSKRRKVVFPEGCRRRTRSFTRDSAL
ncbi:putative ubiquitin-like-specific protease 2B [Ananas comosus]|uniref:Putative ubiquitin-like-specific protease 2B n=1 Tax=Ananas comosus TaxID=4615 RepID=A0A199VV81_ANACO|nr:putative ubiquitin-like-specific protease 2B [Ananas comosus]